MQKTATTAHNMKRVLKIFLLSYFEYCQIWLNIHMDDCHLSNITKLKKKKKKKIAVAHDQIVSKLTLTDSTIKVAVNYTLLDTSLDINLDLSFMPNNISRYQSDL